MNSHSDGKTWSNGAARGVIGWAAAALLIGCGGGGGTRTETGVDSGAPETMTEVAVDTGGGDTAVACATGGNGQLVLAVSGIDATLMPMVRVRDGGLAAPMVLTVGTAVTLPSGPNYKIEWRRVKAAPAAGGIVGKAFYVSASSFDGCIKSGASVTATLTYTQEPGSEKMWMTVSDAPTLGNEIAGYDSAQLAASGTKDPTVWKMKNFTGRGSAGAIDSTGNLWVPGGDRINMYAMASLAMAGDAAPAVTITQPTNASANFAAFDADGNLWITRGSPTTENSVVRYSPADQATSGMPTPAVVLTSSDLMNPSGLAFDSAGNLWVASAGNDKVLKFGVAHLAASYSGAADVALTAQSGPPVVSAYTSPVPLAFDKTGNLWVGYLAQIVKFTPAQQAASGLVDTPLALNLATETLAFDESGGLWMAAGIGNFRRVAVASLGTAGDVVPDIIINSATLGYPEKLLLNPAPTWSVIHDW